MKNTFWTFLYLMSLIIAAVVVTKTLPAFYNNYYDECLSQNLAVVCTKIIVPTKEVFLYYLFR